MVKRSVLVLAAAIGPLFGLLGLHGFLEKDFKKGSVFLLMGLLIVAIVSMRIVEAILGSWLSGGGDLGFLFFLAVLYVSLWIMQVVDAVRSNQPTAHP